MNINGAAGRTITWTFDLPSASEVTLAFQYFSTTSGTAEARVNDAVIAADHPFPSVAGTDFWAASAPLTVSLPAGPVTVRIASTSAIGPGIDLLRATWNDQRPTLTDPSLPHAFEGTAYAPSLASAATDADPDDTLTFAKLDGPAWLTVNPDGTLSGTPSASDVGATTFRARVTDASGLVDDETIALVVEGRPTTPGTPACRAARPRTGARSRWRGRRRPTPRRCPSPTRCSARTQTTPPTATSPRR